MNTQVYLQNIIIIQKMKIREYVLVNLIVHLKIKNQDVVKLQLVFLDQVVLLLLVQNQLNN